jgi:hypothetical protein
MPTSRLSCDRPRIAARVGKLAFAACLVAAAVPATPQSVLQLDKWMQSVDRRSQAMQRNLARQDSAAALSDAREVGELYRLMQDYFTQRGDATEAAKLASDGAALADDVIKSLQSDDLDTASVSAISIARGCRDCHVKYKPLDP